MSRFVFLVALLLASSFPSAFAQDKPDKQDKSDKADKSDTLKPEEKERTSVTQHDMTVNGRPLHYTATAGTLIIRDEEDKPYGSIFYIAYTVPGADPRTRPVTFLYNGGPGSASLWLHMGSVGPVRVLSASPAATGAGPYTIVPNEFTLLDQSDLVFIDAPLTGFSRTVAKGVPKDFTGVDPDLKAFGKVIERYLTVNERWNSPKFLFGESYGTTRSAGLSAVLQESGVSLNGIVLLSSVLNYARARASGMDLDAIYNLPSYAAIAWFHNKIADKPADMAAFVQQAREFAGGEYRVALEQGDRLSATETDAVTARLAHFTGLSTTYLKETKLRIAPTRFRRELLRGEGDVLGRYDARFEGTDVDDAGENPSYDPSDTGITGAYVAAQHDYLERELKWETTDQYRPSANTIGEWDWHHGRGRYAEQMPNTAVDLADTMRKNPKLKVLSANGWFDLATPFFGTEYDVSHMMLTPELQKNIRFTYYPAGHMVYLNVDALKSMRKDLGEFYSSAVK